jgi:hypothetical protein
MLDSGAILAIAESEPERLFSGPDAVEAEYKALAKRWHPDMKGGDTTVFQHIGVLLRIALDKAKNGNWHVPGLLELTGTDGHIYRIRYVKKFDAGMAVGYMGQSIVAYVMPVDVSDLVDEAVKTIKGFRFPDDKFKKELSYRLPVIKKVFKTKDSAVMVIEKPADAIRLRDLLEYTDFDAAMTCSPKDAKSHLGGFIDPKHVAWMTSELLNLACWLEWAKLTHNDISPDTLFVCPGPHTVQLLGGWWHSAPVGERMRRRQTARTIQYLPTEVARTKIASYKTDLELIRLLGRELLGDGTGMRLTADSRIPKYLVDWLRIAASGSAKADYRKWQDVLTSSFGARRFTKMDITFSDIYKE